MADNGKRGSRGSFRRDERRRREPPIIDATATDVSAPAGSPDEPPAPVDDEVASDPISGNTPEPVVPGEAAKESSLSDEPLASRITGERLFDEGESIAPGVTEGSEAPTAHSHPEGETPDHEKPAEGSLDHPAASETASGISELTHSATELNGVPVMAEAPEPETHPPAPDADTLTAAELSSAGGQAEVPPRDPLGLGEQPRGAETIPPPTPSNESSAPRSRLPLILGAAVLALLAGIVILLATEGQRTGSADLAAEVDKLKQQVASLEARPQATSDPSQITALSGQAKDLAGEVASLKSSLADAAGKADAATRQAQDNAGRITALEQKPAEPASAPAAQPPASTPSADAAQPPAGDLSALSAKVDELDKRVAALGTSVQAPPAAVTPPSAGETQPSPEMKDLTSRVDGLQASVAAIPKVDLDPIKAQLGELSQRITEATQANAALSTTVAALPKVDLAPLRDATATLDKRVADLETILSAPKAGDRVTQVRAVGDSDASRAAPLAVVSQAVGQAIDDGRPFASELDALKALGVDASSLAPLTPLAAKGAPTVDALKAQWSAVEPDVLKAIRPPADNVLDRFAAGAKSLVQVRPAGTAITGDSPTALTGRVRAALDRNDVSAALAEWSKLPEPGRSVSQAWADAAHGRLDAATAAQALLSRAIASLGKAGE